MRGLLHELAETAHAIGDTSALTHTDLPVRVDDGDGHEDTSSASQSAHQVRNDGQQAEDSPTERRSGRDDALELLVHGPFAVTGHDHLLLLQLLGDVARARTGDLDPGLAEQRAGGEHERDVEGGVDGVGERGFEGVRWAHVVRDSANSEKLRGFLQGFPNAQQLDQKVVGEAVVQHLRDDEDLGRKRGLQHDGHVGGVEELDGVDAALAAVAVGFDGDFDAEALEVDDDGEDDDGGDEVHDVGETVAVEGLLESAGLVVPGEEEVEQGDQGTFEFGATAGVDGGGAEGLPDDGLADVGSDEEGDARAETVALLEELVKEDDDEGGDDELEDEKQADTGAEVGRLAVKSSQDVDGSLAEGDDESEHCVTATPWSATLLMNQNTRETRTFLSTTKERTVFLQAKVDVDQIGTGQKLHDHSRGDDWRDSEFHEGTSVGGEDDPHPVERV